MPTETFTAIFDTSKAVSGAGNLATAMENLTKSMAEVPKKTGALNRAFNNISKNADENVKRLQELGTASNRLANNFAVVAAGAGQLNKLLGQTLPRAMKKTETQLKDTGDAGQEAGQKVLLSWQSVVRLLTARAIQQGISILLRALREGVAEATDLAIKISEVQTISQDATNKPIRSFGELSDAVRRFADENVITQADAIEAQYQAISNQVQGAAESFDFLNKAIRFSKAANTDLTTSVELLSAALNSYQLDVSETDRLSAIFFKTIELGRLRASDLANDFGRSAVIARQLGVEIEELNAAFATITVQGVKFANAQTFVNNVLLKLIKPTERLSEFLQTLGFNSSEAAIAALGFGGLLRELDKEAQKSGDSLGELGELFGRIRAITGAAILGDNLDRFFDVQDQINRAKESFESAVEIRLTNAGEVATRELQKIKNAFIDIGTDVIIIFQEVNDGLEFLFNNTFSEILLGESEAVNAIISFGNTIAAPIQNVISNVFKLIDRTTADEINKLAEEAGDAVRNALERETNYFADLTNDIERSIIRVFRAPLQEVAARLGDINRETTDLSRKMEGYREAFDDATQIAEIGLKQQLRDFTLLKRRMDATIVSVKNLDKEFGESGKNIVKQIDKIIDSADDLKSTISDQLFDINLEETENVFDKIGPLYDKANEQFQEGLRLINIGEAEEGNALLEKSFGTLVKLRDAAKEAFEKSPAKARFFGVPNSDDINALFNELTFAGEQANEGLKQSLNLDLFNDAQKTFQGLGKDVTDLFGDQIPDDIEGLGKRLFELQQAFYDGQISAELFQREFAQGSQQVVDALEKEKAAIEERNTALRNSAEANKDFTKLARDLFIDVDKAISEADPGESFLASLDITEALARFNQDVQDRAALEGLSPEDLGFDTLIGQGLAGEANALLTQAEQLDYLLANGKISSEETAAAEKKLSDLRELGNSLLSESNQLQNGELTVNQALNNILERRNTLLSEQLSLEKERQALTDQRDALTDQLQSFRSLNSQFRESSATIEESLTGIREAFNEGGVPENLLREGLLSQEDINLLASTLKRTRSFDELSNEAQARLVQGLQNLYADVNKKISDSVVPGQTEISENTQVFLKDFGELTQALGSSEGGFLSLRDGVAEARASIQGFAELIQQDLGLTVDELVSQLGRGDFSSLFKLGDFKGEAEAATGYFNLINEQLDPMPENLRNVNEALGELAKRNSGSSRNSGSRRNPSQRFAEGGPVFGGPTFNTGERDNITALLRRGEFVMRREAVNSLGVGFLNQLNRSGKFANGGIVAPQVVRPNADRISIGQRSNVQNFNTTIQSTGSEQFDAAVFNRSMASRLRRGATGPGRTSLNFGG